MQTQKSSLHAQGGSGQRPFGSWLWLWVLLASFVVLSSGRLILAQPEETAAAPTVGLATYYGGSTEECLFSTCSVAIDSQGDIYVAGTTLSDDFPLVNPYSSQFSPSGGADVFVVKVDGETQEILFSTYVGPGEANNIALDSVGNAYVTGITSNSDFPTTTGAFQETYQGGIDSFYFKLKADGSELLYSTFLGGSSRDEGYDVAVGADGQVYLTGYTVSTDFPTKNAAQASNAGEWDGYLVSFSPAGVLTYATYFGGEDRDQGWAVAVDSSGAAYVTGQTGSDDFPTTSGVVQPDRFSNAGNDAFLIKHNAAGVREISTFFNETGTEEGIDIAVDASGNPHILLKQEGILKLNAAASDYFFLTDIDLQVGVGGQGGLTLDGDGNIFVAGWTGSGIDKDIVLAALSPSGRLLHWQMIGGSDTDLGHQLALHEALDGSEKVVISGSIQSADFPTQNPLQLMLGGAQDAAIVEITGIEDIGETLVFIPLVVRE